MRVLWCKLSLSDPALNYCNPVTVWRGESMSQLQVTVCTDLNRPGKYFMSKCSGYIIMCAFILKDINVILH